MLPSWPLHSILAPDANAGGAAQASKQQHNQLPTLHSMQSGASCRNEPPPSGCCMSCPGGCCESCPHGPLCCRLHKDMISLLRRAVFCPLLSGDTQSSKRQTEVGPGRPLLARDAAEDHAMPLA